jgi:hypothetical protein
VRSVGRCGTHPRGAPRALYAFAELGSIRSGFPPARSAGSWAMPAITRQQKITFGEKREGGVRGVVPASVCCRLSRRIP